MNPTPNPMQDASEPRYTVEEFLAHLYLLSPEPDAREATKVVTWVEPDGEESTELEWDPDRLRYHFEALKKGDPHDR